MDDLFSLHPNHTEEQIPIYIVQIKIRTGEKKKCSIKPPSTITPLETKVGVTREMGERNGHRNKEVGQVISQILCPNGQLGSS